MKKLFTLFALGFLLVLALPSPVLAHDPGGMAAALFGIYGVSFVLLICVALSFFILLFNAFGRYTPIIVLVVNGMFFVFNFLQGFGILDVLYLREHHYSNSLGFAELIMSASIILSLVSIVNIIVATLKLNSSPRIKYIILGVLSLPIAGFAIYTIILNGQFRCLTDIWEGNVEKVRSCVKKINVNKKYKYDGYNKCEEPIYPLIIPLDAKFKDSKTNKEIIKLLLDAGADINKEKDPFLRLKMAVGTNNIQVVKTSLAGLSEATKKGYAQGVLRLAVTYGYTEIVKMLLEAGADINGTYSGWSLLMDASSEGHTDTVEFLLKAGADVNQMKDDDKNALLLALENQHPDTAKVLLNYGASHKTLEGHIFTRTPLVFAAEFGYMEIVKFLLDAGADVNAVNGDSSSSTTALIAAAGNGHSEVVELLIENGADLNAQDWHGTALINSAMEGRSDIVKLLLLAGADVNIKNKYGETALWFAVKEVQSEIVKLLLDAGADVYVKTDEDKTIIEAALSKYETPEGARTIQLLAEANFDINIQDKRGDTVLDRARIWHYKKTEKLLRSYGAKTAEELKQGISTKAPVSGNDKSSLTTNRQTQKTQPLPQINQQKATERHNSVSLSKEEINTPDKFGETLLLKAVKKGQTEEVKDLISKGADVNFVNRFTESVLMVAVKKNQAEITKLLIKAGADVNYKDKFGKSILQAAEQKDFNEIVDILKSAGATE